MMKVFLICAVLTSVISFGVFMQMGLLNKGSNSESESTSQAKSEEKQLPKGRFPQDLAPAAQAKAVSMAAAYTPGPEPHKMVFLTPLGALHAWHEGIPIAWQAETVEEAELVVVVPSKQARIFVEKITYPNNEPPIDRFIHEVEVSVVEAKTGRVLDNRYYRNLPRQVLRLERWETTSIGR